MSTGRAEIWVPATSAARIAQDGARFVRMQDGSAIHAVYAVGSGRWHFAARSAAA